MARNPLDLTGRNALVTGGTRGIGRVISHTLAANGARVGAIYRSDSAQAETTLRELSALGDAGNPAEPFALQADISDEAQAINAAKTALERFGGALDFLILNAAMGAGGPLVGMTTADWRRPFDSNVHGAFYLVRALAPQIRPGGSLVFISSGAGHEPLEGLSGYGASKAAVNLMAGVLAQELGPQGIRVNVVSPGHTDKSGDDPNQNPDTLTPGQKHLVETTALRRVGTAQDVANTVLYFVSDLAGFVTGQWLRVNGGRV